MPPAWGPISTSPRFSRALRCRPGPPSGYQGLSIPRLVFRRWGIRSPCRVLLHDPVFDLEAGNSGEVFFSGCWSPEHSRCSERARRSWRSLTPMGFPIFNNAAWSTANSSAAVGIPCKDAVQSIAEQPDSESVPIAPSGSFSTQPQLSIRDGGYGNFRARKRLCLKGPQEPGIPGPE